MRLIDDSGVARAVASLRLASSVLYQHGAERGIVAFRVADTHIHAIVACSRFEAGRFARYAGAGLRKRLRIPVAFEPSRIRPIQSDQHLANAIRYVLVQESHHETAFDPCHEGSSLPELVGARRLDASVLARVRRLAPRLNEARFIDWMGATGFERAPRDPTLVREAAAAALGIADLSGQSAAHQRARIGAVHTVLSIAAFARVDELLAMPARSVRRYQQQRAEPWVLRAIERQLQLRAHLAAKIPRDE